MAAGAAGPGLTANPEQDQLSASGKLGKDLAQLSWASAIPSFDVEFAQVGRGELDKFFPASGQDGPGRVQGEALDLAVAELGRQRQLMTGGVDLDEGRAVVSERCPERVLQLAGDTTSSACRGGHGGEDHVVDAAPGTRASGASSGAGVTRQRVTAAPRATSRPVSRKLFSACKEFALQGRACYLVGHLGRAAGCADAQIIPIYTLNAASTAAAPPGTTWGYGP